MNKWRHHSSSKQEVELVAKVTKLKPQLVVQAECLSLWLKTFDALFQLLNSPQLSCQPLKMRLIRWNSYSSCSTQRRMTVFINTKKEKPKPPESFYSLPLIPNCALYTSVTSSNCPWFNSRMRSAFTIVSGRWAIIIRVIFNCLIAWLT